MKREPIDSTSIKSAGHEKDVLEIEFTSGKLYRFAGVPAALFTQMKAADSAGKFFGSAIRPKFKGVLVPQK